MRHDAGKDTGPLRLHSGPGRRTGEKVRGFESQTEQGTDLTRNAHGQSLDDAREAFRDEWEAKLQATREQVERAVERDGWWTEATWKLLAGGAVIGAASGLVTAVALGALPSVPQTMLIAGFIGLLMVVPLALTTAGLSWYWRQRADVLARVVQEMERS